MAILVTEEMWRKVDTKVREVIREVPVYENIAKMSVPEGQHEHKYIAANAFTIAEVGDDFNYDPRNRPAQSGATSKLTYVTVPIFVKRTEIDGSSAYGIESLLTTAEIEGRSFMRDRIEGLVFHGSTGNASYGMCNYPARKKYGADGNKALTTYGNFRAQLEGAIAQIRAQHIKPPYSLAWTPGIPAELRGNYASGVWNEMKEFKETYVDNGIIDEIIETDAIVTDANGFPADLSTSNQTFMVYKKGIQYGYIAETYALRRDGIQKPFESDVAYALEWAGGYVPKNQHAVCVVTGLTTTTAY